MTRRVHLAQRGGNGSLTSIGNVTWNLGDKHQVQAKKKGAIRLGEVEIEAFFVPEFRISLLSVGQLDSYRYTSTFKSGIYSNEQKLEAIVFPNSDADELQEEIPEVDEMDEANDTSRQETSKSRNLISPLNK